MTLAECLTMDYSQGGEQAAILAAFEGQKPQSFLDIGAWDPFRLSNTRALFERGWSGVMIEPSPGPMRKLIEAYGNERRITLIQACVTTHYDGTLVYLNSSDDAFSTMLVEQFEQWRGSIKFIGKLLVPGITLAQIGNRFGVPAFVDIDAEGISADLFLQMLRLGWRPRCICVEWDLKHEEIKTAAFDAQYVLTFQNSVNGVFVYNASTSVAKGHAETKQE